MPDLVSVEGGGKKEEKGGWTCLAGDFAKDGKQLEEVGSGEELSGSQSVYSQRESARSQERLYRISTALQTHRVAFPFRSSLSACENSFKPKFSMYAPAAISSVNASSVACSDLVCIGPRE